MQFDLKHERGPTGKVDKNSPFYDLIQEAYEVFKQAPTEHGVCQCCMCPQIRKDFFNHKQANLPFSYIEDWFFAAADSPLDKSIWRFVLPRILEVLASGEDPSNIGIEVSLSRFETGNPKNWSGKQWAVLNEFQKLFLSRAELRTDDCLDDILCMFASAGWQTETLFDQVIEWPTEKLVKQLWKDWCDFPNPDIWITAFWDYSYIPRNFYSSTSMLDKMTNYALSESTPPELSKKAMAISDLMVLHAK